MCLYLYKYMNTYLSKYVSKIVEVENLRCTFWTLYFFTISDELFEGSRNQQFYIYIFNIFIFDKLRVKGGLACFILYFYIELPLNNWYILGWSNGWENNLGKNHCQNQKQIFFPWLSKIHVYINTYVHKCANSWILTYA